MQKSLIERAYELAVSQSFSNVGQIERALTREGHRMVDVQATFGRALRKELLAISRGTPSALPRKSRDMHRKTPALLSAQSSTEVPHYT